ncbi:Putative Fork head protein [Rhizopus microsporus]|nr:Putative Fork head protein [Rhizopus microsporus]
MSMNEKSQYKISQFSIIRELPGKDQEPRIPSQPLTHNNKKQKSSELRFKIEPIGVQPEDDDDLETCPSRTRPSWPRQINPWWKPADRHEKPPYSYATLIAHAILSSKDGRLTLSDIYKWISEAYPYYQRGVKGWQNSIRHNLSLNKKWFVKLDRRPTQAHPGKGGYWTLQPMTEKLFVENLSQAGGHSRRHHDIGTYTSLSTKSRSSAGEEEYYPECPNIHITRPEDYEVKKTKSTLSAPRMRNMTQETQPSEAPKTDPKSFVIRFNSEGTAANQKRGKKNTKRAMEDADSDIPTKRRKSTTTITNADTITASEACYPEGWCNKELVQNGILQDFWMHEPDQSRDMLLTSSYNPFCYDPEAQNILNGLQAPADGSNTNATNVVSSHPDMKTIDLQFNSLEKNIHYPDSFSLDQFNDPSSNLYIADLNTYNIDQYLDFSLDDKQPSDLLKDEDSFTTMNCYWPDQTEAAVNGCFDYC